MSDVNRSVVGTLWHHAATSPGQLAVIENQRGRWTPMTVGELSARVAALAVALAARGVGEGSRVALLVGNSSAWLVADLAVQAAGGVAASVPPSDDDEMLAESLEVLGLHAAIVEDAIAVQRLDGLADAGRLDPVPLVVQLGAGDERADGVDDLVAEGERLISDRPTVFAETLADRRGDAAATITFSAGSGGSIRAVVHTAAALEAGARQVAAARRLAPNDVAVVALDPSHPFERSVTLYPAVVSGAVLAYPESAVTIDRAIMEVQPTFAHLPIEHVRQAAATIRARLHHNRGVKRLVARWWERSAHGAVQLDRAPSRSAVRFVGSRARKSLGWDKLDSLVVTCVAVPVAVASTLNALGQAVDSGYAVVEAGLVGLGRAGSFTPLSGNTVSARDGLLTVTSPALAVPTHPAELGSRPPPPGGFVTGDLGRADDTGFTVSGPADSALELDNGGSVLAAAIEGRLRESPFVGLAVVRIVGGDPHATIEVDRTAVGDWAAERKLQFTTLSTLVALPEVRTLIADEVARLATDVATHDLLQRPLQQGREITRTRTTVHGRLHPADADEASTAREEQPSAVE